MRQLKLFVLIAAIGVTATSLVEAGVKSGREHRKEQRDILEIKKQLVIEEREADAFAKLVAEMNSLHMPSRFSDFWKVNKDIRHAMKREYEQLETRIAPKTSGDSEQTPEVQRASHGVGMPGAPSPEFEAAARLRRMKAVMVESGGLQQSIALGDMDGVPRYRHLIGDFLGLMREDIEASWAEARRREARWE